MTGAIPSAPTTETRIELVPRERAAEALTFLNTYWAKDHIYYRSPELFRWSFGDSPAWHRPEHSFVLARAGNRVVGCIGGIPFILWHRGVEEAAIWPTNWLVLPETRGSGIGRRLIHWFETDLGCRLVGLGINRLVEPLYKAWGWTIVPNMMRYVMPGPGALPQLKELIALAHPDLPGNARTGLLALLGAKGGSADPNLGRAQPLDESWNAKGWPGFADEIVGAKRDLAYLEWRYRKHPLFAYTVHVVEEAGRFGLLVFRTETITVLTALGREPFGRALRVVEFLPVSETNAVALGALVAHELRAGDITFADYYCTHGRFSSWLDATPFVRVDCSPHGEAFPSRFQPLNGGKSAIPSAVRPPLVAPQYPPSPGERWYWTRSDSDLDRPN
ncbi:MAG: N-acetyltransferase [Alphaproteobacteria bacterium]|nr:N-acetyltransferase [Alphaproteobacteria bacterium]